MKNIITYLILVIAAVFIGFILFGTWTPEMVMRAFFSFIVATISVFGVIEFRRVFK